MVRKTNKKKVNENNNIFEREINVPWYVWALGILVIALVLFFLTFSGIGKVNYKGLVFEAEKYGQNIVYHYSYYFQNPIGEIIKYNIYLHNNPKKNNVFFNADIVYPSFGDSVKFSINTSGLTDCPESSLAIGQLSQFLVNNGFNITVGATDSVVAKRYNMTYITCDTHPNDFVISLEEGNKTQISQKNRCYKIEVSNCEIEMAVEKFMIESIVQARDRVKRI